MRIGEINKDNYKDFLNLFQNLQSKTKMTKANSNLVPIQFHGKTLMLNPNSDFAKHIDKNGRLINSDGMEGMDITGRTDFRRLIPISEHMAQHAIDDVKKAFYEHGGMSGDDMREADAYHQKIKDYLWTVDVDDRAAATWTINQVHLNTANAVKDAVREKVPDWDWGKPIDPKVLDEIFADETITSKFTEGIDVTPPKGFNVKV